MHPRQFLSIPFAALLSLGSAVALGQAGVKPAGKPKTPTELSTELAVAQAQAEGEKARREKAESAEGQKTADLDKTKQELTKAQIGAAAKTKEADDAKRKEEEAKGKIDELRNGKLISSGLTGGVALAVQFIGPFNNGQAEQATPAVVAMPYIMALPGYWGSPQSIREACASSWNGSDEDTIDAAARAVTRKRAARIFDSILARVATTPGVDAAKVVTEIQADYEPKWVDQEIVEEVKKYQLILIKAKADTTKAKEAEDKKKQIIEWMAGMEWRASRIAMCWHKKIGFWIGLPLSYDATTKVPTQKPVDDDPDLASKRTIDPRIAFGLAFSPNAYFSLLAGFTVSSVTRDDKNAERPAFDRTIWGTTIAVGGNLDIAAALVK